jgi:hypothetical protein
MDATVASKVQRNSSYVHDQENSVPTAGAANGGFEA